MSSTNKQLRDGIRDVRAELDAYIERAITANERIGYLTAARRSLEELLAKDHGIDDPTDTERLDHVLSRQYPEFPDRAAIDAAMRPAPKYRPWTAAEAIGRQIRELARPHCIYTIVSVSDRFAWTGPATCGTTFETVLREFVCHPDGTPCGVEVE